MTLGTLWMALAVVLPAVASLLASMSTVDLAYQVRAGDLMLQSGQVLRSDPFTFSAAGDPWLNQQWLAQVLLALKFEAAGWAGLALVRATSIAAIMAGVLVACRLAGAGPRLAALLAVATFVVGAPALSLRPQLLGLVLLAWAIVAIMARDRSRWTPWLIPVMTVAWANVHGTFVLAPVLVGIAWLDDATARRPGAHRLLGVLGLTLAATLLSPWGIEVWRYVLALPVDPAIRDFVSEWRPTSPLELTGLIAWASVAGAAALIVATRTAIRWPWLLWLAGLAALALITQRGIVLWAIGAPSVIVPAILALQARRSTAQAREAPGGDAQVRPAPVGRPRLNVAILAAILLVGVAAWPGWRGGDPVYGPPGLLDHAPEGITEAVRAVATSDDRVFNAQLWGSWFEWALPGIPVFVDSRIEVIPDEAWRDYRSISAAEPGWRERLTAIGPTILALGREQQAALIEAIVAEPGWRPLHEDEDGVVLVRSDRP